MTMKGSIKDQYVDRCEDFIKSLPKDAIEVDTINDNSISMDDAKKKVQKAINNISANQGLNLDSTFEKVANY